jgi:replication factor C subunit 3/5
MSDLNKKVTLTVKYYPQQINDILSQDKNINILKKIISIKRYPHMIFYGPSGVGKTSTIYTYAKELYKDKLKYMVLELNASDERGIEVVRDKIKLFSSTQNFFADNIKLIILDEADSMTGDAQSGLRRIIEEFSYNVRFCIICNNLSKIINPIKSRCMKFRFNPLIKENILEKIKYIIKKENINITEEAINEIIQISNGDFRRILNTFDSCCFINSEININTIHSHLSIISLNSKKIIIDTIFNNSIIVSYEKINKIKNKKGYITQDVLSILVKHIYTLELSDKIKANLIQKLADIEYNIFFETSDKIQLLAIIGLIKLLQNNITF